MTNTVEVGGLKVKEALYRLIRNEIAPGTGVEADAFWASLGKIVNDLGLRNRELLEKRDSLQEQIDAWYLARERQPINVDEYKAFLTKLGYLVPEGENFQVATANARHF